MSEFDIVYWGMCSIGHLTRYICFTLNTYSQIDESDSY